MRANEEGLDWIMNHKPDLGLLIILLVCSVWIASTVMNFDNRLRSVETQLPELRNHVDVNFKEMNRKIDKLDSEMNRKLDKMNSHTNAELMDIKLMLMKMDTYRGTTNSNYKSESKMDQFNKFALISKRA